MVNNYYEPYLEFKDYINQVFSNENDDEYNILRKKVKNFSDLHKSLETINDRYLSFIKLDYKYFAFNNGVLNIDNLEFGQVNNNICCGVYFNSDFDINLLNNTDIETKDWDNLIKYQIGEENYDYFIGFIGRLFFNVGEKDNWQCSPFILGQANTGKSTVFNIISKLFGNIGTISDNTEAGFGLSSLYDKQVLLCPELPENMNKVVPRTQFQSIVSGENINISIKNKLSKSVKWNVPLFMGGNHYPNYKDKAGSVSRRLASFKFETEIKNKDTKLEQRIINNELPSILIKCIKAYFNMIEEIGDKAFEDWDNEYFRQSIEQIKEETNLFYCFMTSINNYTKIEHIKDEVTRLEDLKKVYLNYLRYQHPTEPNLWHSSNIYTLKKLGYIYKSTHICSSCDKKAVIGCCDNFSRINRKKKMTIINLRMTKIKRDSYNTSSMLDTL